MMQKKKLSIIVTSYSSICGYSIMQSEGQFCFQWLIFTSVKVSQSQINSFYVLYYSFPSEDIPGFSIYPTGNITWKLLLKFGTVYPLFSCLSLLTSLVLAVISLLPDIIYLLAFFQRFLGLKHSLQSSYPNMEF